VCEGERNLLKFDVCCTSLIFAAISYWHQHQDLAHGGEEDLISSLAQRGEQALGFLNN